MMLIHTPPAGGTGRRTAARLAARLATRLAAPLATLRATLLPTLLAAFSLAGTAHADERGTPRAPPLPLHTQECGACHLAYPPGLLPAASWQRLMDTLPRHYGTDASVDAATRQQLSTWLAANAGTYKRVREAPPDDRISRSAWFIRKHDEVPTATWQRPAIKSAANCQACHPQADRGAFNEHDIRIPR